MSDLCFTIEGEPQTLTVRYSQRELKCLGGRLLPSGEAFIIALGLWDKFSVAKGMDTRAWTSKSRILLLRAAEQLLESLQADREFFRYDYQYGFSSIPKQKNTAGMGIAVGRQSGIIDARDPGQIYIKFTDGHILDLRKCEPVETPLGVIKIHRRKNQLDWQPKLARLIEFLRSLSVETVRIRHHHPE